MSSISELNNVKFEIIQHLGLLQLWISSSSFGVRRHLNLSGLDCTLFHSSIETRMSFRILQCEGTNITTHIWTFSDFWPFCSSSWIYFRLIMESNDKDLPCTPSLPSILCWNKINACRTKALCQIYLKTNSTPARQLLRSSLHLRYKVNETIPKFWDLLYRKNVTAMFDFSSAAVRALSNVAWLLSIKIFSFILSRLSFFHIKIKI